LHRSNGRSSGSPQLQNDVIALAATKYPFGRMDTQFWKISQQLHRRPAYIAHALGRIVLTGLKLWKVNGKHRGQLHGPALIRSMKGIANGGAQNGLPAIVARPDGIAYQIGRFVGQVPDTHKNK
jgi:hypothetical protein